MELRWLESNMEEEEEVLHLECILQLPHLGTLHLFYLPLNLNLNLSPTLLLLPPHPISTLNISLNLINLNQTLLLLLLTLLVPLRTSQYLRTHHHHNPSVLNNTTRVKHIWIRPWDNLLNLWEILNQVKVKVKVKEVDLVQILPTSVLNSLLPTITINHHNKEVDSTLDRQQLEEEEEVLIFEVYLWIRMNVHLNSLIKDLHHLVQTIRKVWRKSSIRVWSFVEPTYNLEVDVLLLQEVSSPYVLPLLPPFPYYFPLKTNCLSLCRVWKTAIESINYSSTSNVQPSQPSIPLWNFIESEKGLDETFETNDERWVW